MPGIFGCTSRDGSKLPRVLAEDMERSMTHESWYRSGIVYTCSSFLGAVALDTVFENDHLIEESDGNTCVVVGKVYNKKEVHHNNTTVGLFRSFYKSENPNSILASVRQLNGSFAFAIYDENKGKMIIGSDRYGSKNIYYSASSDRLIFSSEIKSILKDPIIHPKLNFDAIVEFFTFSFLIGNKTFFDGIKLLSPASILFYDFDKNKIQIRQYWDFEYSKRRKSRESLDVYIKTFTKLMARAIERRMIDKDKIGIFLSGGLDSRLIAGFAKKIADKQNKELISFTFGTRGGWQEKIAKQVAGKLGIENRFYEIPPDFITRYANEVVYKGDGHIRIRDAHFISLLNVLRREIDAVLVGLFGSELFGEVLSKHILGISNNNEIITYLFDRYEIKQNAEWIPAIFSKNFRKNLKGNIKKNVIETVKTIRHNSYDEIADYWELRQRDRRYIIPLSNYMGWYLDTRLPFLDNEVVDFAINLPIALRIEKKFIHIACKRLFPSLAEIPWEKSGVPPDTKGLSFLISQLRRSSEIQMKRFIEKVSGGKILFQSADYRGYAYWLRTGSRKYVENLLLTGNDDRIFDQKSVKKILNEHMSCRKDHDQLICDLLNINLLMDNFSIEPE